MTRAGSDMDRVDAALEAAFPSTPLNVLSRRINRLAELLPKDHECEPIFGEFDAMGEYVRALEAAFDAARAYIHGGQDRGAESQERYTAWIKARNAVESVSEGSEQTTPPHDDTLGPKAAT